MSPKVRSFTERSTHAFPAHTHNTPLWKKTFRCQWNQSGYLGSHHLLSWVFVSIMSLHALLWRRTYDEFVHSTNVTTYKCPFSPSFPLLPVAAVTVTKHKSTLEGWSGEMSLPAALRRCWQKAQRCLIIYGPKYKQEICTVFDKKRGEKKYLCISKIRIYWWKSWSFKKKKDF